MEMLALQNSFRLRRESSSSQPHRFDAASFRTGDHPAIDPAAERLYETTEETQRRNSGENTANTPQAIDMLMPFATFVHLSGPKVINIKSIKLLLEHCPNLQVIEIPKSLVHLAGTMVRELLEARGVEVRTGRVREGEYYDTNEEDDYYKTKKHTFQEFMKDPEKRKFFERMKKFEIDEAEIAELYYGDERISAREIAERLGVRFPYSLNKLMTISHWLGFTENKTSAIRIANISRVMDIWEKADRNRNEAEKLRQQYSFNGIVPPRNLPVNRWEMWQKVMEFSGARPSFLFDLIIQDERSADAFKCYFCLSEFSEGKTTLAELGKKYGVTREMMRHLKNRVLENTGLLDEN